MVKKMNTQKDLPNSLKPLYELSMNLWFSWNPDVRDLYREMDLQLWRSVGRNPVAFLKNISSDKLNQFAANQDFQKKLQKAYKRFLNYMNNGETIFSKNYPSLKENYVAYFSAEYGLHESLPNYAGGLGILAGDHCKTASDLGLPFVAVGLLYKHAYFNQTINVDGEQEEHYSELNYDNLPMTLVADENNEPVLVSVRLIDREVYIKIWQVKIGRISLYLLDTTVDQNNDEDKDIIHSLYGGSRDTRIQQEIILGIGGLRALRKMGINPSVFHMNEGHSAFLGLERLFELMNEGMAFKMALELVKSTTLFTTHTPIPAGNEAFEFEMMERYFKNFWPELEISDDYFFDLGRNLNVHQHEHFSLTVFALNLSYMANGVSKLHGYVSRRMWRHLYPGLMLDEIPIGYVTNGVHTESWLNRKMIKLFDEHLGLDWRDHIYDQQYWDQIKNVPDEAFADTLKSMKTEMMNHLRRRYQKQLERYGDDNHGFPDPEEIIDDKILTIGFSRRFAPYKRATLIFNDAERLKKILNNPDRPMQILFSGKAHPHNDAGKELIRAINNYAKQDGFKGKIIFIEDYNINVSRSLVSGVDVWLNNPRRPLEASGTSGQKVPINGGINFSVLDGWWPEGYNGQNGWIIGTDTEHPDSNHQDNIDANSFYDALENEIIPLYYDNDGQGWIKMAKESLASLLTTFSTHTMLMNYIKKYYVPGMKRHISYTENDFAHLFQYNRWVNRVNRHWKKTYLNFSKKDPLVDEHRILSPGESKEVGVRLHLDGIKPEELLVELVLERQDAIYRNLDTVFHPMGLIGGNGNQEYEYRALVTAKTNGSYRYNCRVIPTHPDFFSKHETRLVKWLD